MGDVVVHIAHHHGLVDRLLEVQAGLVLPGCASSIHKVLVSPSDPHGQAIGVYLDDAQGDLHQRLGQQAQQQLTVERDGHGEQRIVEHAELVVAVAVDPVERQLEHGRLCRLLGVGLALLEQLVIDDNELLAQMRRVEPVGDGKVWVVRGDIQVNDDVLIIGLDHLGLN